MPNCLECAVNWHGGCEILDKARKCNTKLPEVCEYFKQNPPVLCKDLEYWVPRMERHGYGSKHKILRFLASLPGGEKLQKYGYLPGGGSYTVMEALTIQKIMAAYVCSDTIEELVDWLDQAGFIPVRPGWIYADREEVTTNL